jgi:hypothetical protein
MAGDRRTRITIETERILIIARQHAAHGWCERCGQKVKLLPSVQASRLLRVASEQLGGLDQSRLHLEQAKDGLVICLKSLLRFLQPAGGQHSS